MSCECQVCGKEYKVDLMIDDVLWERIKPKGKFRGAGLLCGSCIMRGIEAIGRYKAFRLEEIK